MKTEPTKVAMVMGSSSGFGAAIAERLASEGYLALINAPAETAEAKAVRDAILASGHKAELAIGDLTQSISPSVPTGPISRDRPALATSACQAMSRDWSPFWRVQKPAISRERRSSWMAAN
jgi:NAD(P)-dependent dehydrogenase (short-subunit alcohol dehydrogenase family)